MSMSTLLEQPYLWVMLAMLTIAAITDLRTGFIPNQVVAYGAAAGVLVQLLVVAWGHTPIAPVLMRMGLGLLLGAAVPLALYAYGVMGGGDVKLFAAIGLCVGPWSAIAIQLWAHVIALCFVPIYLAHRGRLLRSLRASARMLVNLFLPARSRLAIDRTHLTPLRFAPAILAAAVWVCLLDGARP